MLRAGLFLTTSDTRSWWAAVATRLVLPLGESITGFAGLKQRERCDIPVTCRQMSSRAPGGTVSEKRSNSETTLPQAHRNADSGESGPINSTDRLKCLGRVGSAASDSYDTA